MNHNINDNSNNNDDNNNNYYNNNMMTIIKRIPTIMEALEFLRN